MISVPGLFYPGNERASSCNCTISQFCKFVSDLQTTADARFEKLTRLHTIWQLHSLQKYNLESLGVARHRAPCLGPSLPPRAAAKHHRGEHRSHRVCCVGLTFICRHGSSLCKQKNKKKRAVVLISLLHRSLISRVT